MDHYLIPDMRRISSRDLMIISFYADDIYVADGLLYWSFLQEGLPVLSHHSRKDQENIISDLAELPNVPKKTLKTYSQLIGHGRIKHGWFGSKKWEISASQGGSPKLESHLRRLSEEFRKRRPEVSRRVRTLLLSQPSMAPSVAIAAARREVFTNCLSEVCAETPQILVFHSDIVSAFDSHESVYISDEKIAEEGQETLQGKMSYTGALADVISDLQYNPEFCPIFASPDVSRIVNRENISSYLGQQQYKRNIEFLMGVDLIQALPAISFRSADDMLELRYKNRVALSDYNNTIGEISEEMVTINEDDDPYERVSKKIQNDLLPAVREMRDIRAKYEGIGYTAEQTGVVAGASQILVGACTLEIPLVLSGMVTALSAGGVWAVNEFRNTSKMSQEMTRTGYKGLSLTLDLGA